MGKTLALDISTTTTGFAVMSANYKLLKSGQFTMKERLSDTKYSYSITKKVEELVNKHNITDLIIEDVFYGQNIKNVKTWCRVHGAVAMFWYNKTKKEPFYIMATEARKVNDINGQATKIEVQLEMAKKYNLIDDSTYYDYCGKLSNLLKEKKSKKLNKNQFDYRIKKLSKQFEEETGISEHIADAILLGLSIESKE